MEKIKKNINKIVVAIVLIFIITFIYNYTKKEEVGDIKEVPAYVNKESAEIINLLNELSKIQIDESFFNEDISSESSNLISFSDLNDFSEAELLEKPIGKRNPFVSSVSTFVEEEISE